MLYDASCLHHPHNSVFDPSYWQAQGALETARGGRGTVAFVRAGPDQRLGAAPLSPRRAHGPSHGRPLPLDRCRTHARVQGMALVAPATRLEAAGAYAGGGKVPACSALLPRGPAHGRAAGAPHLGPGVAAGAVAGRGMARDRPVCRFAPRAWRAARRFERAQPARRHVTRHLRARLRSWSHSRARTVGAGGTRTPAAFVAEGDHRPCRAIASPMRTGARCWLAPALADHLPCDCSTSC